MSIKPIACADNGVLNWYADSKTTEQIDLYVIPDTHRVVPVELLQATMTGAYPFESKLCEKIRAIIEDKP